MGILSKLIGGSIGEMANGVANAINQFVETSEEKKAADMLLMKIQQDPDRWQTEINKIEAGHRRLFVAGWRPAIGWICASALAWGWIIGPCIHFLYPDRILPAIAMGEAISLVMAMLGMGALRTYEKKQGITG